MAGAKGGVVRDHLHSVDADPALKRFCGSGRIPGAKSYYGENKQRQNTGFSPLRSAPVEMTKFGVGLKWWLVVVVMLGAALEASASGPRWVTGPPFYTGAQGAPVGWRPGSLTYSTDPGDLSATVNHAAADALVAAAAGVWNLPVANLTVSQAGVLGEQVSGSNVYLGASGLVWPTDVASVNAAAIPIAVVYDRDGSVTDLLLGGGASAPSNCRQAGVTEDVDLFDPAGYILHAVVIVNGRCTGSAAAAQTQLQYQLMRAFGRVLGLAWSQTNDNVFTGVPAATPAQAQHWPVMHPIDILCGPYTYQCMPQPFVLRPDDIASMVMLYGIGPNDAVPAGKQVSLAQATAQNGTIAFPDGQGMAGVNVLVTRMPGFANVAEGWAETSAVTGTWFRRVGATPLAPQGTDALSSQGTSDQSTQGYFRMAYIPYPTGAQYENHVISTEAVNPLYIGEYSLGPYAPGTVAPSGTAPSGVVRYLGAGGELDWNQTVADATADCGASSGQDGTEALPAQASATGWWSGTICAVGHAAWFGLDVKAGRTLTLDVSAVDELGQPSTVKAMPVLGAWNATDALGTLPTLGETAAAFNAMAVGTSRLGLTISQAGRLRLMVTDQRGEGRPDFGYNGRILYADSVVPALLPSTGATVTIAGMGFRAGNAVTVNGVAATVTGWTANSLTVAVPAMSAVHAAYGVAFDVVVTDRATGATSTMSGALSYDASALPETMRLVGAPVGNQPSGSVAATPFAVQVLRGDGVTPVAGESVVLSVAAGSAQLGCGTASCAVVSDANGMASSTVLPLAAGGVTLQAVDGSMSQTASFMALAQVVSVRIAEAPSGSVPVQTAGLWMWAQALLPAGNGAAGVPMSFSSIPAGAVRFGACEATACTMVANGAGLDGTTVTPLIAGPVQLVVTSGGQTASATFIATPNVNMLTVTSTPSGTVNVGTRLFFAAQLFASDGVTPLPGHSLIFSAPSGVTLDACGASPCALTTSYSPTGTGVVPQVAGVFTVQVTDGVTVRTASFTAVVPMPQLKVLSVPANGSVIGAVAAQPFKVQLVDGSGAPMAGYPVALLPRQTGNALMLGCAQQVSCWFSTDANGTVSTVVEPMVAGEVDLQAVVGSLSLLATVSFQASAGQASVTAVQPSLYVAEDATVNWTVGAVLQWNGAAAVGQVVTWTGSAGFSLGSGQSGLFQTGTNGVGATQASAVVGPLAANAIASAAACSWGTVCVGFQATGVSASLLRALVVSGTGSVVSGGSPTPVVLQVIDTAGHPVAGAAVTIYQTANEALACPAQGRCPAAPVMASATSSGVSDTGGLLSVTPLVWAGGAGVTHMAASVGTQGFVALELSTIP
ncbi:IPT/TIG domain-containing protein [Granulicella rosea]|uniref:IPT/TIG domain-containing protein n=1 Tax=Granulicella rosea TaxID=474952 RepID=A0A239LAG9_9BACT|nr:IPT/TIG domain-containing protein [Granulicella rosea]SNT27280.1 IPT/TIG domain-containing protein [Granulicella rosea]